MLIPMILLACAPQGPLSYAELGKRHLPDTETLQRFAPVDLDGDGAAELVTFERLPSGLTEARLWWNDGKAGFAQRAGFPPAGLLASDARAGDLDGDGDQDLVLCGDGPPALQVLRNDGAGLWLTTSPLPPLSSCRSPALVDLDGDRDLDVLCTGMQVPRILLNLDRGRFTHALARNLPTSRLFPRDAAFGDVDRDGFPELLACTLHGEPAVFLRNLRDGTFTVDDNAPSLGAETLQAIFVDVNGDDALDVVAANGFRTGEQDRLLINHRGRLYDATATRFPVAVDSTSAVTAGDLDGDGDQDLVFLVSAAVRVKLWLNGGSGQFAAGGTLPPLGSDVGAPRLGDVDGDGDLDAYVARMGYSGAGAQDLLLENRAGTFSDVTLGRLPIALDSSSRVRLVDLDQDGDLDVVVRTNGGDKVLANDGTGRFAAMNIGMPASVIGIVATADVDLDGDLDLLLDSRVLRNLRAQLDAPRIPIAGGAWPLDLYGARGAAALAVVGTREIRNVIPGLGILRVDPASGGVLGPAMVPLSGSARIPATIPPSATLIGLRLWLQGVIVEPSGTVRLTNAFSDVVH